MRIRIETEGVRQLALCVPKAPSTGVRRSPSPMKGEEETHHSASTQRSPMVGRDSSTRDRPGNWTFRRSAK